VTLATFLAIFGHIFTESAVMAIEENLSMSQITSRPKQSYFCAIIIQNGK